MKDHSCIRKICAVFCLLLAAVLAYPGSVRAEDAKYPEDPESCMDVKWPEVRDQDPYNDCWIFATCFGAEESLIMQGRRDAAVDFSELQLAYFTKYLNYNGSTDPLGGTKGDGAEYSPLNKYINDGGDYETSIQTLLNWAGPVDESVLPYRMAESTLSSNLDPSYQYSMDSAHLNAAYSMKLRGNREQVKKYIRKYGAGLVCYEEDEDADVNPYYNEECNSYYDGKDPSSGHSVAIVGWDDNFPKENFNEVDDEDGKHGPDNDGAWLIRNSWGNDDFGHDGYFWMSYESELLDGVYFMEMGDRGDCDHNYQYDGSNSFDSNSSEYGGSFLADSVMAANVFTAHANSSGSELLKAISFETRDTQNADYRVEIYRLDADGGSPVNGSPVSVAEGSTEANGCYYVALGTPVTLSEGQRFSVVVTMRSKDGGKVCFSTETKDIPKRFCSAEAGQSYFSLDGGSAWTDFGALADGNIRIKAFTSDSGSSGTPVSVVSGGVCTHPDIAWEVTREATPTEDGEMSYRCPDCGYVEQKVTMSGYTVFIADVCRTIRNVKQGATVEINTDRWMSFHHSVIDQLEKRPDVSVKLIYRYQGKTYETFIPAGTDLRSLLDINGYVSFLQLGHS